MQPSTKKLSKTHGPENQTSQLSTLRGHFVSYGFKASGIKKYRGTKNINNGYTPIIPKSLVVIFGRNHPLLGYSISTSPCSNRVDVIKGDFLPTKHPQTKSATNSRTLTLTSPSASLEHDDPNRPHVARFAVWSFSIDLAPQAEGRIAEVKGPRVVPPWVMVNDA